MYVQLVTFIYYKLLINVFFCFIILLTLSSELLNFLLTFVVSKLKRTFGKQRKQKTKTGGLKRMYMYTSFHLNSQNKNILSDIVLRREKK